MRILMAGKLVVPGLILCALGAYAQPYGRGRDDYRYDRGRTYERIGALVQKVHYDLERAPGFSRRDRGRLDRAEKELWEFQRQWNAGRYNWRELDEAVGAIRAVVDRNALPPRDRAVLLDDLNRLREIRGWRDGYGGRW